MHWIWFYWNVAILETRVNHLSQVCNDWVCHVGGLFVTCRVNGRPSLCRFVLREWSKNIKKRERRSSTVWSTIKHGRLIRMSRDKHTWHLSVVYHESHNFISLYTLPSWRLLDEHRHSSESAWLFLQACADPWDPGSSRFNASVVICPDCLARWAWVFLTHVCVYSVYCISAIRPGAYDDVRLASLI